ncbi:MAG TPA: cytochrome c [Blastocatellia bacterium]|nr:cytochrome c [Blastocatellia bacterium]
MLRRLSAVTIVTLGLILAGALSLTATPSIGQNKNKTDQGRQLFMTYCASCHGEDAKGNGPAATALKKAPANLTQIPKENGKFPALRVRRVISGDDYITGHGSREMPIWGSIFRQKRDTTVATANVYVLMRYVESIQEK